MVGRRGDTGTELSTVPIIAVRALLDPQAAESPEALRMAEAAGLPAGGIWNRFRPWAQVEDGEMAFGRHMIQSTGAYDDDREREPDPAEPAVAYVWGIDGIEAVDETLDGLERAGLGGRTSNDIRDVMRQLLGMPEAAMFAARRAASRRVAGILVLRRTVSIGVVGAPYASYSACIESYAVLAGGTDLRASLLAAAGMQIQADLLTLADGLRRAGHGGEVFCSVSEAPSAKGAVGTLRSVADLAADLVKHRYREATEKVGFTTFSAPR
ncbi:hypothetical protein MetexDRAFT_0411 [Methylorubrum extorquens DSM 13060]|uniref:Uncharacterized protein n=1 Tax=Methylorubrum extorquens DSM 13060 TaxID=882800 RepID=H1KCP9_METEX|nr:hypothetical protein MetexDRAFT_0411 [Methylorubrum extorquens DSM 13060]